MTQYRRDEKTGKMALVVSSTYEYKKGFADGKAEAVAALEAVKATVKDGVEEFSATAAYVAEFGIPGWAKDGDLAKSVLSDVLHDQNNGAGIDELEKHVAFAIQAGIEHGLALAASTLEAHPGREWFTANDGIAQWRLSSRADFVKAIRYVLVSSPQQEGK